MSNDYKVGDCVWVKLKGFPHWPARIDKIDNKKYTMFYFGTHEIGRQKKSTLTPFAPYRDKYTLYRGACPKVLLEGVLEAEDNPGAKPDDTLSNLNSDSQIWMVMGKEGQEDFEKKYPERAKHAKAEYELYAKEMKLERLQEDSSYNDESDDEISIGGDEEETEDKGDDPSTVKSEVVDRNNAEVPAEAIEESAFARKDIDISEANFVSKDVEKSEADLMSGSQDEVMSQWTVANNAGKTNDINRESLVTNNAVENVTDSVNVDMIEASLVTNKAVGNVTDPVNVDMIEASLVTNKPVENVMDSVNVDMIEASLVTNKAVGNVTDSVNVDMIEASLVANKAVGNVTDSVNVDMIEASLVTNKAVGNVTDSVNVDMIEASLVANKAVGNVTDSVNVDMIEASLVTNKPVENVTDSVNVDMIEASLVTNKAVDDVKNATYVDDTESECSQDSEIEVTMNVKPLHQASTNKLPVSPSFVPVIDNMTSDGELSPLKPATVQRNDEDTSEDSDGPSRKSCDVTSERLSQRIKKSYKPTRNVKKQTNKIKILPRKRVNSETAASLENLNIPPRKKRRTQSETLLADCEPDASSSSTSAPSSPTHHTSSPTHHTSSPTQHTSRVFGKQKPIGWDRRGSLRFRQAAIAELNNCLRYSLRKSNLNESAANLILGDIEKLSISSTDSVDNLVASLSLITTLDKLPSIKKRSSQILAEIGNRNT